MTDKDDDWHDRVASMADDLGLKGRERTAYIHEHMTRRGYRAVPQYVMADDDDDDDDRNTGFFGSRRRSSGSSGRRQSGGRRRSRERDDDDDSWYED